MIASFIRPFTIQWLYFSCTFNEMIYQMPRILPDDSATNLLIFVSGVGDEVPFSALMSKAVPMAKWQEIGGT